MDSRNPFLKGLKKLKHKLAGGSRKRAGESKSETDRDGRKADVEGREASQRNPLMHSGAGDVVESGPSLKRNDIDGGGVDSPTSAPSILCSGEPCGT
jgi:hypothetical protein